MSPYKDHAERGADLLDEKWPNWFEKIKLRKLNMKYDKTCVLGQLYSEGYTHGAKEVGVDSDSQYIFGFNARTKFGLWMLKINWKRLIRERLKDSWRQVSYA